MSYTLIEKITLASASSGIDFISIPQDYDDLIVKVSFRSSNSSTLDNLDIRFNSQASNWSGFRLYNAGAGGSSAVTPTGSGELHAAYINADLNTANTFNNGSVYIFNYTASKAKPVNVDIVQPNNTHPYYLAYAHGLWNNTAAITSINLFAGSGSNLLAGCTASLYGITAGGDGTVTTA